MSSLRTVSTRRLLIVCVIVVAIGIAGAAIALGAGSGSRPPRKSLAAALHAAVAAPRVAGITARITFRNHLIDASSLQGSDPLLAGATGRLWVGANDRLRLELQSDGGDAQIVSDGRTLSVYDASSNTAYRVKLAARAHASAHRETPPSLASVKDLLARLMKHADIGPASPTNVAGHPAYSVRVSPKHAGGLLGRAELAWDAVHGVPLRAAIYARGSDSPVLELKATDISFGSVPASTFVVSLPANAKTVTLGSARPDGEAGGSRNSRHERTGAAAVTKSLPFSLSAPASLVGLPRHDVRRLDWEGQRAALVTYGSGLGAIAVIERAAGARRPNKPGEGPGLTLPKVSIHGATGQELDTALGTLVSFERGGVSYVVVGSIPPAAAEAAARGL